MADHLRETLTRLLDDYDARRLGEQEREQKAKDDETHFLVDFAELRRLKASACMAAMRPVLTRVRCLIRDFLGIQPAECAPLRAQALCAGRHMRP